MDRYITRRAKSHSAVDTTRGHYRIILEAIAESSLVTWFGLLLYGVACLAPHGHITVSTLSHLHRFTDDLTIYHAADQLGRRICHDLHSAHLLRECIRLSCRGVWTNSMAQGISQCLLIARLGFATSMASASYSFTEPEDREIRITIQKETEIDTHGSVDGHSEHVSVNLKPEFSRV